MTITNVLDFLIWIFVEFEIEPVLHVFGEIYIESYRLLQSCPCRKFKNSTSRPAYIVQFKTKSCRILFQPDSCR